MKSPDCEAEVKFTTNLANKSTNNLLYCNINKLYNIHHIGWLVSELDF